MEFIEFACKCGKPFKTQAANAGRRASCPACGRVLVVPQPTSGRDEGEPATTAPALTPIPCPDFGPFAAPVAPLAESAVSGKATAALMLGLVSFCMPLVASLPALILGILAIRELRRSDGTIRGEGPALVGIALGGVATILALVAVAVGLAVRPQLQELSQRGAAPGPPPLAAPRPVPPPRLAPPPAPVQPAPAPPPSAPGFPPPPAHEAAPGFPPPPGAFFSHVIPGSRAA